MSSNLLKVLWSIENIKQQITRDIRLTGLLMNRLIKILYIGSWEFMTFSSVYIAVKNYFWFSALA